MKYFISMLLILAAAACREKASKQPEKEMKKQTGWLEKHSDDLYSVIAKDPEITVLAEGFEWSEGPLWVESSAMLLFSDVPTNTIYKWTAAKGKEIYLQPSGYTGSNPSVCKEPGSNGLLLDPNGNLVLCQHGDRRMARMDAPVGKPEPVYITLADRYLGKRFSSPNDAVYSSAGELYFTDPPYGLQTQDDTDPKKEQPHNGVYKLKKDGTVLLLTDSITRPNGIAFFPGEEKLIVACSDPQKPNWYIFDVAGDSLKNGRVFYSAAEAMKNTSGLPDGLKITRDGTVFATGPGGIWIFDREGTLLGKIRLEEAASNLALSTDEKTIYITNDSKLISVRRYP